MNAEVVTVSSRIPKESYYRYDVFLESLRRFAMVPTVLGMNEPWRGLMTKPLLYRKWLRDGSNTSDRIIITDAWDIVFAAHPHGVGDVCAGLFGDAVVFNAERACWPRADLAGHFQETGSPWRYLNSGFICGPADRILAMLEAMNLEQIGVDHRRADGSRSEPNDQGEFQKLFTLQPVPMMVDGMCRLAQTFSGCTLDEFDFSGGRVQNKLTGTFPGVLHANGQKEIMLPKIIEALNL